MQIEFFFPYGHPRHWQERGENISKHRRAELTRVANTRIEQMTREANSQIERSSADISNGAIG